MMKTIFCVVIFALIAPWVRAQTNLTELLQQGMFEEQANHNLDAAISNYQALSTQFDKDRQLAATAIFRLGECYREEGLTNQAAVQYRRILNEFPDQKTLVTLSQEDLAGMGAATSKMAGNPASQTSGNATGEAALLASQISGIESLKSDPEEESRATLAIFPAQSSKLEEMVLQLPKLRDQEGWANANPKATYYQMFQAQGVVRAVEVDYPNLATAVTAANPTNAFAFSTNELNKQTAALKREVSFVLQVQKARLKALQAAAGTQTVSENAQATASTDDQDQEIARIQQMIQNSPDLINAPGDHGHTPLEKAAMDGSLKVAAFLLDHGADVNSGTPLLAAATAGQRTMIELLLEHGADVNAYGGAALEAAIGHGYEAVAETLLKAHADVNLGNNIGQTPLILAARAGKTNFIRMLLDAGANPNIADNGGVTPLSSATLVNFPLDLSAVNMLLAAGADPNGGRCNAPLLCAINNRNTESAELLLKAGANPNLKGWIDDNLGRNLSRDGYNYTTPLWAAVNMGQPSMVKLLLKYKADPSSSQINNTPAIFRAVDKTNVLEALLDAGANPNVVDQEGRTPLSLGARISPEVVKLLLAAGADPNGGTLDAPLLCAIDKQDLASAELLLQAGANPNVDGLMRCLQGSYGSRWYGEYSATLRNATPLWLAIQWHQLPIVQLLLKYKANPNAKISEPPSVIFWALDNTNILQALLDGGANPNVKNGNGETPLKIVEDVESGNRSFGDNIPPDQLKVNAVSAADLLRQHGALEVLPDWDHITVSRPSTKYSNAYIYKGTNNWNQFTLMELFMKVYYPDTSPHNLSFPDFARIAILRPYATGEKSERIPVNVLNSTNGIDCSRDVALEFGDVVEIPEREHTLAEGDAQTEKHVAEIMRCLRNRAGTAKLIVDGGQTIQLPLEDFEPVTCYLGDILANPVCRNVLLSDSDLSRINVTRRDPKTGKLETWSLDRSANRDRSEDPNDLWVRDGDVIEVPEQ